MMPKAPRQMALTAELVARAARIVEDLGPSPGAVYMTDEDYDLAIRAMLADAPAGTITSAINSPGRHAWPASGTSRLRPPCSTSASLAPAAVSTGRRSAAGAALAMLPPMVARLRICTEPN